MFCLEVFFVVLVLMVLLVVFFCCFCGFCVFVFGVYLWFYGLCFSGFSFVFVICDRRGVAFCSVVY